MKITIFSLQEQRNKALKSIEDEYIQRLNKFTSLQVSDLSSKKMGLLEGFERQEAEADLLLSKCSYSTRLIILDEHGKEFNSRDFAQQVEKDLMQSSKELVFAIAGPYGWSERVRKSATYRLSLSQMTYTSELARIIFIEQLYRAFTIIRGLPYHK
jgi:23S rRNA (pseudouridine1915-N3)-methyltransferase